MSKRIDLATLEAELKEHDWTYEMSDDHSYWTSGTSHRKEIKVQVEKLYDMGLGKKVEVLFYKHYPVKGCHEVDGYGIKKNWEEHLDRTATEFVADAKDKHLIMKKGIVR